MLKLGNIYYSGELVNHTELDYIDYVDVSKHELTSSIMDEFTKPTLIVGWSLVKGIIAISDSVNPLVKAANVTILDKRIISKRLYWEYSFDENKHFHISGVESFIKDIPDHYFSSNYTYINIDPVFFSIENITQLTESLPKEGYKLYNYKDEMLYVLYENRISGIDLKLYTYFNFNITELVDELNKKCSQYIYDKDGTTYQNYYKKFPQFDNLKRYIVVFLSN